jgi:hypothetical protein
LFKPIQDILHDGTRFVVGSVVIGVVCRQSFEESVWSKMDGGDTRYGGFGAYRKRAPRMRQNKG